MRHQISWSLLASAALISCGPKMNSSQNLTTKQSSMNLTTQSFSLSCDEFIGEGFRTIYSELEKTQAWPSHTEFSEKFENQSTRFMSGLSESQKASVRSEITKLYDKLSTVGGRYSDSADDVKEKIKVALTTAELRIPNDDDSFKDENLVAAVEGFEGAVRASGVSCWSRPATEKILDTEDTVALQSGAEGVQSSAEVETFSTTNPLFKALKAKLNPAVYGARKVMSVAYQSCEATSIRPLTVSDSDLRGLRYIGQHSIVKSVSLFDIGSVNAVVNSHFYIKNLRRPASSCFNTSSVPLIYDFGGKPNPYSGDLNIFANAGTGSRALGIDCSGFVFSSLASAGMKLWATRETRPTDVMAVNARAFMSPKAAGLSCLDRVFVSNHKWPLVPGDIVATPGHVLMIDSVKKDANKEYDPFGINSIKSVSQCTSSHISTSKFDFVLIQSSATKMIGINRIHVREFLKLGGASMSEALRRYALSACYARFGKQLPFNFDAYGVGIVRHRNTPSCKGGEVALARESCLNSCGK